MPTNYDNYQKRRVLTSYFWVVVSIFLVLFLLGLQGLLLINATRLSDYFKENIALTVYFNDDARQADMDQLTGTLVAAPYARQATFVSADEAARRHSADLGENFVEFLGENPLQDSVDLFLNAEYVDTARIDSIASVLQERPFVEEVRYDRPLITLLNKNVKRISYALLIASGVLALIAVLLINSSIRLSVYSQRFTIKTMQMVGATKSFIRRPFVWRGVRLGLFGALLALVALAALAYFIDRRYPQLALLEDPVQLAMLAGAVIGTALIITFLSTWMATQRFLNLKTDALY